MTVVDGAGAEVAGAVADVAEQPGASVWTPEEPLAYGTSYTLTASATNADDEEAKASSTFTTVTPATLSTPSIGPLDGMTVGVGMPIRVYFDDPVTDKAAVESHLLVTSSDPDRRRLELVQRLRGPLPALAVLAGQHRGHARRRTSTAWTSATASGARRTARSSFSIGAKHVSIADAGTHMMEVYDGDQLVQTYPDQRRQPGQPELQRAARGHRAEPRADHGLQHLRRAGRQPRRLPHAVEYAVRISDSGEFVHAAPWSVAQQGNTNVSHGCINMSTERAAWFFNFSQPGDVVEIQNSTAPTRSALRRHLRLDDPVGPVAGRQRAEVSALRPGRPQAFPAGGPRAPLLGGPRRGEPWIPGSSC